jgi:hypothetical protein
VLPDSPETLKFSSLLVELKAKAVRVELDVIEKTLRSVHGWMAKLVVVETPK